MNQQVASRAFEQGTKHRITAIEFEAMVEARVFPTKYVELDEGELVDLSPSHRPHGEMVARISRLVGNAYPEHDWVIYVDCFVGLNEFTMRAPDVSVVSRHIPDGKLLASSDVMLAVEISDSSLENDLRRKRPQYAAAGIAHYWVVDIEARLVHRFSQPGAGEYGSSDETSFGTSLPLPAIDATIVID